MASLQSLKSCKGARRLRQVDRFTFRVYSLQSAAPIKKEDNTMSINEMESKSRELRQLQALIEEAQAEAEAIKDSIKAAMGDSEALQAGEYKVTWKPVTSSRLDAAALRKALPDVAERFTRTTTTRRFTVA